MGKEVYFMELGLVLTLCGLGGAFLLTALILGIIAGNRKRKCTESTTAVIIRYERRRSDHITYYHPVYEYTVDNVTYTRAGAAISGHTPQINSVVPIMYNLGRPKQSYIQNYDNKAYKILTIVFAVIGCIPIIICIGIALFA